MIPLQEILAERVKNAGRKQVSLSQVKRLTKPLKRRAYIQYDVVFHRTVVSFLLGRSSRERRLLFQFSMGCSSDPFQTGDFEIADETWPPAVCKANRPVRSDFLSDHAVKESMSDIERVS